MFLLDADGLLVLKSDFLARNPIKLFILADWGVDDDIDKNIFVFYIISLK